MPVSVLWPRTCTALPARLTLRLGTEVSLPPALVSEPLVWAPVPLARTRTALTARASPPQALHLVRAWVPVLAVLSRTAPVSDPPAVQVATTTHLPGTPRRPACPPVLTLVLAPASPVLEPVLVSQEPALVLLVSLATTDRTRHTQRIRRSTPREPPAVSCVVVNLD